MITREKHQPDTAPADHGHGGYEKTDAHAGASYRAGLYILGVMFLVAVVLVPLYRMFVRAERGMQPERATVIREAPAASPFPKLVTDEPLALAQVRAQEEQLLGSYGWVEKDRAIARMPVAEAMRLVGERGALPTFPAASPSPASAGSAAGGGR
jgi:hypothetical protein